MYERETPEELLINKCLLFLLFLVKAKEVSLAKITSSLAVSSTCLAVGEGWGFPAGLCPYFPLLVMKQWLPRNGRIKPEVSA